MADVMIWESMGKDHETEVLTKRAKVAGGWLYMTVAYEMSSVVGVSTVFVADPPATDLMSMFRDSHPEAVDVASLAGRA